MNATREESEQVANELPTGFGLLELSILISIIYYTFQLWKACYTSQSYAAGPNGHDPSMLRLASRRARRAARHHKVKLSKNELAVLTMVSLDHVAALSESRLAACRNESYTAELDAMAATPDDDDDEQGNQVMTLDEKLARIKDYAEKHPPTEAELEAAADSMIAEIEAKEAGTEVPVRGLGVVIGAAIIGGIIARR